MLSRRESERARARARLQLETPISDDANLRQLQEQAEAIILEAKSCNPSGPELVSTVIDEIARNYFRHVQKRRIG